jgi:hypothetical protein
MNRTRALLVVALIVGVSGCTGLRDVGYVEQDLRRSGAEGIQPLLEFFEAEHMQVQSRRISPPLGSTAGAVYSLQVTFANRPNTLTVYTYGNEEAATRERQRYDYGQRERTRRRHRTLTGRERETAVRERAPVFQEGPIVIVVHERDPNLERALREAFGRPYH